MIDAAKKTADGVGETVIIDHTEAGFQNESRSLIGPWARFWKPSKINTVQLRRTIYLTIQSSVDFEECVHKLLKLQIPEKMWKGIFESHSEPFIEFISRNVSHDCGLLWTE